MVVRSFAELKLRGSEAAGKVVVFNQPFVSYGETVAYRAFGASEAAKVGAVATLIRSITPFSINRWASASGSRQVSVLVSAGPRPAGTALLSKHETSALPVCPHVPKSSHWLAGLPGRGEAHPHRLHHGGGRRADVASGPEGSEDRGQTRHGGRDAARRRLLQHRGRDKRLAASRSGEGHLVFCAQLPEMAGKATFFFLYCMIYSLS